MSISTPKALEKRQAIMDAALAVFVRDGYKAATIEVIALEASVSRQTVYSHFGDKSNLYLAVVEHTVKSQEDYLHDVLDEFPEDPVDLESELTAFTIKLTLAFVRPAAITRRRLVEFAIDQFPEAWRQARAKGAIRARSVVAGHLARLSQSGRLDVDEPARAARQFMTLIYDPGWELMRFGAAEIDHDDIAETVRANVTMFLRAYRANPE